jgi:hypothetical protein
VAGHEEDEIKDNKNKPIKKETPQEIAMPKTKIKKSSKSPPRKTNPTKKEKSLSPKPKKETSHQISHKNKQSPHQLSQ